MHQIPDLNLPEFAKNCPEFALGHFDASESGGIYQDLLGLTFAQRKIVAADLDFHRVAHRSKTNQFHFGPHEQSHFHQTGATAGRDIDLRHGRGGSKIN
jgi:hypothetical protein